ncbi:MAG: vWA domain-containing protein [Burkholderiales bacterium]
MTVDGLAGQARGGTLAENVMHFARLLRGAGLPVGPDRVIDALDALQIAGIERRDDFYWTLASVFLGRRDQFDLYDEAFRVFWRDPRHAARVRRLPEVRGRIPRRSEEPELSARLIQALAARHRTPPAASAADRIEFDAILTFSAHESLRTIDFESMTNEELAAARAAVAKMRPRLPERPTRRHARDPRGARIDPRASLQASLRGGGAAIPLCRRSLKRRAPPLVALVDVSGSMSRYTRMFLHFLHALARDCSRVSVFTFGTRLTNVTRQLRQRDADAALARVSRAVSDWSGGTRIGACIGEFNRKWSRRLLGQGAVVLLISDGLDREGADDLARQMERLHKSCRRLIWLNPLLRYPEFEAKPAGVRAMLPHVDAFLPVHNLQSLNDLAAALANEKSPEEGRAWR